MILDLLCRGLDNAIGIVTLPWHLRRRTAIHHYWNQDYE